MSPVALTPDKLFQIFTKYPVGYLPLVTEDEIRGYISKANIIRLANFDHFMGGNLRDFLAQLFVKQNDALFFKEIENKKLLKIPAIDHIGFFFKEFEFIDFVQRFRPVTSIETEQLIQVFNQITLPLLIFNNSRTLLYQNEAVKRLHNLFCNSIGEALPNIIDFFPDEFFEMMKGASGEVRCMKYGKDSYQFRIQSVSLEQGSVCVVVFLNAV